MKTLRFLPVLALLSLTLVVSSCQDDDLPEERFTELRLDQANQSAPVVEAGTRAFAVQFYESDLERFAGRTLQGIRVFIGDAPSRMRLSVHVGGDTAPGQEVSSLVVTGSFDEVAINDYELVTPVTISDRNTLWIVAEVDVETATGRPIGCDAPGSGVSGGQWLRYENTWETFLERGGDDVNWNIRGLVE